MSVLRSPKTRIYSSKFSYVSIGNSILELNRRNLDIRINLHMNGLTPFQTYISVIMLTCTKMILITMILYIADELDSPISNSEVIHAIKRLKNDKPPGVDGVPAEFFKVISDMFVPF